MTSGEAILTLDLGTSLVKATAFAPDGAVIACASAPYPTLSPRADWAEQDPARWWAATVEATRSALAIAETAGYRSTRIHAIGVTGQMHGLVLIDRSGTVIGPCLTVQDRRAIREVRLIDEELGEGRVYALAGARLEPASPLAKLRWLAGKQPELLARAHLLLAPKDYLRFRLTGEAATEPIDAAGTLLYDLRQGRWSRELTDAARIPISALPPIQPAHSIAGTLRGEPAAALGLPAGIPVAIGAGDDVECLGAGLLKSGHALEHMGTTGSILVCCEELTADPAGRVDCYPHALPGSYLLGGSTGSAGATLAWAAHNLTAGAAETEEAVAALLQISADGGDDPSADLVFLPYLAGERCPVWKPGGRGLLIGLTLGTTQQQIIQAVYAGVAFSLRHILDCIRELGVPVDALIASGGGGAMAGEAWPQVRSTVYGHPLLRPPTTDSTSLGAFILTMVALGAYPHVRATAAALVPPPSTRLEPLAGSRAGLERRYALYRAIAGAATPLFDRWPT